MTVTEELYFWQGVFASVSVIGFTVAIVGVFMMLTARRKP